MNEMSNACNIMVGNMKGRDPLKDEGVDGRQYKNNYQRNRMKRCRLGSV
jgi:hypothetical protein